MNEKFLELTLDNAEIALDILINNEIIKEIPILGNSLKIIQGIKTMRDRFYIAKIEKFITNIGNFSETQKEKLLLESKFDSNSKTKFSHAIYNTIEQSDSEIKIEILAYVFEGFLNNEITRIELRKICHGINLCFSDLLLDIVEKTHYSTTEFKEGVNSGFIEERDTSLTYNGNTGINYIHSDIGSKVSHMYKKYKKLN